MGLKHIVMFTLIGSVLVTGIYYNKTELSGVVFDEGNIPTEFPTVEYKTQTDIDIDNFDFSLYLEKEPEILVKEVDEYNRYNEDMARKREEEKRREEIKKKREEESEGSKLLAKSKDYLGVPYVWGGESRTKGLDCSAFVRDLYSQFGYKLPRVSRDQAKVGKLVSRSELKKGDLLFFDTRSARNLNDIKTPTEELELAAKLEKGFIPNKVSHVGIYIGEGKMIHASSGNGYVIEAELKDYYKNRFLHARRIIGE